MSTLLDNLHIYYARIWSDQPGPMPLPLRRVLRLVICTIREIRHGDLTLRAMSLVYTTLLALVPLLALSFSLFKGLGIHNQIEPMLLNLLEPLGSEAPRITETLLGFVDNVKIGVLGSIGVALLFYTVLAMIQKVEAAFNHIWHIPRTRSLGQRVSQYLVALLVGPLALSLIIGITATLSSNRVVSSLLTIPGLGEGAILVGRLMPFAMICLVFTSMFLFVPNTRVRLGPAALGGVVSGLLWQAATIGFASFVANSGNYNAVYSSFAILILLLIWLYIAWLILLVGCQITFLAQNPRYQRPDRHLPRQTPLERETLMLDVLVTIGQRFRQAQPPLVTEDLLRQLQAEPEHLLAVLEELIQAGVLADDASGRLLLARSPSSILLHSLPLTTPRACGPRVAATVAVRGIQQQLQQARENALGETTLDTLLQQPAA